MEKISQTQRLYNLLSDGQPHSVPEIMLKVYGIEHSGYCNVHGRITDIRKKYGVEVKNLPDINRRSITWYQMTIPVPIPQESHSLPPSEEISSGDTYLTLNQSTLWPNKKLLRL